MCRLAREVDPIVWTKKRPFLLFYYRDYFLQGKREEAAGLLTRLLERRFGPLTEETIGKVSTADLATLEDWSLRLLDAHTLEEVLQST